jgi:hypothetical protein
MKCVVYLTLIAPFRWAGTAAKAAHPSETPSSHISPRHNASLGLPCIHIAPHRTAPHRIIPLSRGFPSLLPSIFFSFFAFLFLAECRGPHVSMTFHCLWPRSRVGRLAGWMNWANARENEWLNAKVDPATCPAGAGMSGMGPLHETMVSLGTRRSGPPGDQDFNARTTRLPHNIVSCTRDDQRVPIARMRSRWTC